ncbi:hypothetical protein FGO68_gene2313 [Halteria grandinella]|uniref:Uncharacterized protein n=1 Tax=Halteria grandinella TaxID=5974 RepID=A0A8J8T7Z5_HALGN|nr:hypothetical protein FGO68_gene2313 [Halteria grandinella]
MFLNRDDVPTPSSNSLPVNQYNSANSHYDQPSNGPTKSPYGVIYGSSLTPGSEKHKMPRPSLADHQIPCNSYATTSIGYVSNQQNRASFINTMDVGEGRSTIDEGVGKNRNAQQAQRKDSSQSINGGGKMYQKQRRLSSIAVGGSVIPKSNSKSSLDNADLSKPEVVTEKKSNKALFKKAINVIRLGSKVVSRATPDIPSEHQLGSTAGGYSSKQGLVLKGGTLKPGQRRNTTLDDLLPEHRILFEKLLKKQQDMLQNLAALKQQQNSYQKYKQSIKREHLMFRQKSRAKELKLQHQYQREEELSGRKSGRNSALRLKSSESARSSLSAAISRRNGSNPVSPTIEQVVRPILSFSRVVKKNDISAAAATGDQNAYKTNYKFHLKLANSTVRVIPSKHIQAMAADPSKLYHSGIGPLQKSMRLYNLTRNSQQSMIKSNSMSMTVREKSNHQRNESANAYLDQSQYQSNKYVNRTQAPKQKAPYLQQQILHESNNICPSLFNTSHKYSSLTQNRSYATSKKLIKGGGEASPQSNQKQLILTSTQRRLSSDIAQYTSYLNSSLLRKEQQQLTVQRANLVKTSHDIIGIEDQQRRINKSQIREALTQSRSKSRPNNYYPLPQRNKLLQDMGLSELASSKRGRVGQQIIK